MVWEVETALLTGYHQSVVTSGGCGVHTDLPSGFAMGEKCYDQGLCSVLFSALGLDFCTPTPPSAGHL